MVLGNFKCRMSCCSVVDNAQYYQSRGRRFICLLLLSFDDVRSLNDLGAGRTFIPSSFTHCSAGASD